MTVSLHDSANGFTPNPDVEFKDSPSLDAFGRQRISTPYGIFDFKAVSGRGNIIWEERLTGCIIVHGTVTGAGFVVGHTITGGTSGKKGVITAVGSGNITYTSSNNDFTDGETITSTNGSTATVTSHNTGADVVYNYDRSSIALNLGTVSGQKVIRQTVRYFTYNPGYSQLIDTTQIFNAGKTNLKQTVMYGDSLNGLGLVLNGTTLNVLKRSSVTGSTVDTLVPSSDWLDILDGSGSERNPSGILLDITKAGILSIDFQWLGVGRVRFSLNINGQSIPVYDFDHSNNTTSVYMKTPSLPIRYEIENTGTTASASTLEQICCTVASEGGYLLPGYEFCAGNRFTNERNISVRTPIFAIRLKNEYPTGKPNRKTIRYLGVSYSLRTNDATFELVHVHNPLTMTATWTSRDDLSAVEFSTDISALTAEHMHVVDIINIFSGQANKGEVGTVTSEFINQHSFLSQNYESNNSQMFVVYATPRTGASDCSASIPWIEFE